MICYIPHHLISALLVLQPDNPAELSGKIYEMMTSAIAGKWSSQSQAQPANPIPQHAAPVMSDEPLEAEVVESEPVEAGQQK